MAIPYKSLTSLIKSGSWSLFLDRDGVINRKLHEDYVKNWEEFEFIAGVTDAIALFNPIFQNIFIVTNQQGIGKGLMKKDTLDIIHTQMMQEITAKKGRIDKIYYCPDLANSGSLYRKPNIGMALQARKEFPGVNLRKSIIAGDSVSDMKFGRKSGMKTVFISTNNKILSENSALIDYCYPDLLSFAKSL